MLNFEKMQCHLGHCMKCKKNLMTLEWRRNVPICRNDRSLNGQKLRCIPVVGHKYNMPEEFSVESKFVVFFGHWFILFVWKYPFALAFDAQDL
jgi:hypothetical protein